MLPSQPCPLALATLQTLKAEIMMKEQTISGIKKEFGVAVYQSMEAGDQADTSRIFAEFKAKIDALNADIAAKRLEIQELEKAGTN
jgi:hypothetical protein